MPTARSKNSLKNLGLLAGSLLASVVLAEFLVRAVYPQQLAVWHTMRDGLVIHPPGLVTHLVEFDQVVRFNAFGMRDRERTLKKAQGTKRVLVLGDSFMEALQVSFEDSFPSLLESGLRTRVGRDVEVVNVGVGGWGQDDQLAYLRKHGLAFEPDLILIAMTMHNDVFDNLKERFHTLVDGQLVERPAARISEWEYQSLRLKGFFASRSHLWQLLRKVKNLREIRILAAALDDHVAQLVGKDEKPQELERGWALTFELFKEIRDIGKGAGARTAIMLIPLRLQLENGTHHHPPATGSLPASDAAVDKPQQAMRTFGRDANVEIIDLLPVLRSWTVEQRAAGGKASLHLWEGHWNATGHRLAADVAVKAIVGRQLLKP
jgi:hypothetical protein